MTGKPAGKGPLGSPRRRWEDNIRMDLEEIGINAGKWVDSAQDRNYWRALVNAALNHQVSKALELISVCVGIVVWCVHLTLIGYEYLYVGFE